MRQVITKAAAFAVTGILFACASTGSYNSSFLNDAEISAMAALGRPDGALTGPLYKGDGGKDLRLAVLAPELRGGGAGDEWLPVYVQGFLHSNFRKYSAMTLIDRQNLDQIIKEQDLASEGRFSDDDFIKIGSLTNARYFLTGMMQKLPGGEFAVSLSISDSSTGESSAAFIRNGSAAAVQDGSLLNDATEALLTQMGVTLTETGRRTLMTGRYMTARAEAGYARGVAAEAGGAAVEALLNFSQAVAFDPSRLEALSRLGSVSSEISGGSISADILNDLQARDAWLEALKEAAAFFNSRPPFEIIYDPNLLQIGNTDYAKRQANLAMRIRLMPSEAGFSALNALIEGLDKTDKRGRWGFAGWPLLGIKPQKVPEAMLFHGKRSFSFMVEAGLVNEAGKVIARGKTTLKTGKFNFKAGDPALKPPGSVFGQIDFPGVNAADLTPTLTVVIAGVNGLSGREISETGYMRIAPGDASPDMVRVRPMPANMVRVKGGTFQMGSPSGEAGRNINEDPHTVRVGSFYMGKYEVTQREWQEVMGSNPSYFKGADLPVENVSWYDAIEYCNKWSIKEGLSPAYTRNGDNVTWNRNANGYRLPTEAEWEYACRAGTATPFNTGNNITTAQGNYDGNYLYNGNEKGTYREMTWEVGRGAANGWGLYDMHGNVREWCWDWYREYGSGSQTDPSGPASGSHRVLRGGDWFNSARYLRSAYRSNDWPSNRGNRYGFRLVRASLP
jgi:formylglycine-generating enzyme required for sulfatase activity